MFYINMYGNRRSNNEVVRRIILPKKMLDMREEERVKIRHRKIDNFCNAKNWIKVRPEKAAVERFFTYYICPELRELKLRKKTNIIRKLQLRNLLHVNGMISFDFVQVRRLYRSDQSLFLNFKKQKMLCVLCRQHGLDVVNLNTVIMQIILESERIPFGFTLLWFQW